MPRKSLIWNQAFRVSVLNVLVCQIPLYQHGLYAQLKDSLDGVRLGHLVSRWMAIVRDQMLCDQPTIIQLEDYINMNTNNDTRLSLKLTESVSDIVLSKLQRNEFQLLSGQLFISADPKSMQEHMQKTNLQDARIQDFLLQYCSPSFREKVSAILLNALEQFKVQEAVCLMVQDRQVRTCIICFQITLSPGRVLVVTDTPASALSLHQLCSQVARTSRNKVHLVGSNQSITIDRETSMDGGVLIGDLERIIYLIQHQYLKVFLVTQVVFQNASSHSSDRLECLLKLLPSKINKTIFHSEELTSKLQYMVDAL